MGLLFAVGSALIFVLGFPTLWYFVALAFALGVGIAVFLRVTMSRRSKHHQPLSILTVIEKPHQVVAPEREGHRHLVQAFPKLSAV